MASLEWKEAFKKIHNFTPKKADYAIAPAHIRDELCGTSPCSSNKVEQNSFVRLKRPLQPSPIKSSKRRLLEPISLSHEFSSPNKTPSKSPIKHVYEYNTRSPKKPVLNRQMLLPNVLFLLKSPTKTEEALIEDVEPQEDEVKVVAKKRKKTKKKTDENYVKLNLRKKTFVRGKVTAEQKRKFLRKIRRKAMCQ